MVFRTQIYVGFLFLTSLVGFAYAKDNPTKYKFLDGADSWHAHVQGNRLEQKLSTYARIVLESSLNQLDSSNYALRQDQANSPHTSNLKQTLKLEIQHPTYLNHRFSMGIGYEHEIFMIRSYFYRNSRDAHASSIFLPINFESSFFGDFDTSTNFGALLKLNPLYISHEMLLSQKFSFSTLKYGQHDFLFFLTYQKVDASLMNLLGSAPTYMLGASWNTLY